MRIGYLKSAGRRGGTAFALAAGLFLLGVGGSNAWAGVDCKTATNIVCRAEPLFPGEQVDTQALDDLGSTGAPDDDLLAVLQHLETATGNDAAKTRGRALAIIDGSTGPLASDDKDFLSGKAYAGMPLLNTEKTSAMKVRTVPAGERTVDVHEVRYGDHALLDTSMLRFDAADMDDPFTIRWYITELGTSFGGQLSPAGVPTSGPAANALLEPLAPPALLTGTMAHNRFHPAGDTQVESTPTPDHEEETRIATQMIEVPMPSPNKLGGGILDPNLTPGHETFAQIAVGQVHDEADPADPDPILPADADDVARASTLWQIRDALEADRPLDPDLVANLVAAMRSRDALPIPSLAADANLGVAFANAEAYISKRGLRVAPGGSVSLALTNLDNVDRTVTIRQLRDRSAVESRDKDLGVTSWGAFTTDVVKTVDLQAGMTQPKVVTVTPDSSAYSLWIGDMRGGDQAGTAIELDRGPRQQSLELGLGPVKPLHEARDKGGNMWVTLANSDEVVRLSNVDGSLSDAKVDRFPIPGGIVADPPPPTNPPSAPTPVLGPGDVAIDSHGIVWVTLVTANQIARIDPAQTTPGTTDGIDIIRLKPCTDATCRQALVPGAAAALLSRLPLQMKLRMDRAGNTELFFSEQAADAIGALRMARDGRKLDEQHFNCVCLQPLGIALDPNGDIWYSEGTSNRIGRMTLDPSDPFNALLVRPKHYDIPHPVQEFVPGGGNTPTCGAPGEPACQPAQPLPNPALTTLPHSVALDRAGRVWYTGEASETIGYLDPKQATPNTSDGFHDTPGPENEFGRALAPADLAIDASGTAYIADEYGDQIATAKIAADGSIHGQFGYRPTGRNSLTDSPLIAPNGDLWFIEGGANLITRISGVAAPTPPGDVLTAPAAQSTPAPRGDAPGPVPPAAAPAAPKTTAQPTAKCSTGRWLTRTGSGRKVRRALPLLGLSAADARRCLGRPAGRTRTDGAETWTYRGLKIEISRGKVIAFTLLRAGLGSSPDRAQVGARVDSFRRALGALARTPGGGYRGVVSVGTRDAADVRLTVKRGRVARVTVALTSRGKLDRAGLRLLRQVR
jgi:streptogramin lyase